MTFEEYEKIMSELWSISLELFYLGTNLGEEVSKIDYELSRTYEEEDKEKYERLIEEYRAKKIKK